MLADSLREVFLTESLRGEERERTTAASIITAYDDAITAAIRHPDRRVELAARLGKLELVWFKDPGMLLDPEVERIAAKAHQEFELSYDQLGLARVWYLRAHNRAIAGRLGESLDAAEHAITLAREMKDVRHEGRSQQLLCFILDWGPTPVGDVIEQVQKILDWASGHGIRSTEADALNILARAEAIQNRFSSARAQIAQRNQIKRTLSELLLAVADEVTDATIELLADKPVDAQESLRKAQRKLKQSGGRWPLATVTVTVTAMLARSLLLQGRDREAEELTREYRDRATAPEVHLEPQIRWRLIEALLRAKHGQVAEAEELAREAVALSDRTEQSDTRAQARCDLAEVLGRARLWDEAVDAALEARQLWEQKGNLIWAHKPAKLLQELGCPIPLEPR
jgi:hypothetical protein